MKEMCAYPVPNVEPSKRNHKENSRPSVLASNYENAKQRVVYIEATSPSMNGMKISTFV